MKLTVRQLKQLIKEQIEEQFYETSKNDEDSEDSEKHSSVSLKDAQKAFEDGAGQYLEALVAADWSRFDAVQQLVSLLKKIFKSGNKFKV